MGVLENVYESARAAVQEWTGYTVAPLEEVTTLRETYADMGFFLDEVEDMGATVLDYVSGRPHEVQAAHRRRLAQQSRLALIHDPTAGAEAQLRSNFAFGRGIGIPQATDEDVQEVIERAWKDPNNERKLTSFEAQRHRSNEMLAAANLFPTLFVSNGKVRVGFRDSDDVTDIVTDPDDDETPLWYVIRKRKTEWDFSTHQLKPVLGYELENGQEKVWYVKHWRNVEDLDQWAKETSEKAPAKPDSTHILDGLIEHFRINRIGRSQFGVPPMARTLRFYTALNQLTESQVQMRQGAATLIAQRIKKSGPRDLMKNVSQVMARTGEIAGRRRFAEGGPPSASGAGTVPGPREAAPPPPAGSWWGGSDNDRIEAVNLRSGAGEALQDAQIVRAPIAAASGFGQHYLGDASSANLATATTLELPTLMEVSAWQETFEGIFRWFTDRAIEEAVRAGQLGGMISEGETIDPRSLGDLRIREDKKEMETRTGKDLSYSFQMPYPGRRNLPDVMAAVSSMLVTVDPLGKNWALREKMLDFAFRHGFQTEDPSADVETVMQDAKRIAKEQEAAEERARVEAQQQFQGGPPNEETPDGAREAGEGPSPPSKTGREDKPQYPGQKMRSRPPANEMGAGTRTREVLAEANYESWDLLNALMADAKAAWAEGLGDPGLLIIGSPPPRNGNSAPAAPGQPGPLT